MFHRVKCKRGDVFSYPPWPGHSHLRPNLLSIPSCSVPCRCTTASLQLFHSESSLSCARATHLSRETHRGRSLTHMGPLWTLALSHVCGCLRARNAVGGTFPHISCHFPVFSPYFPQLRSDVARDSQ